MKRIGLRSNAYTTIQVVIWASGIVAGIVASSQKFEVSEIPSKFGFLMPIITWMQEATWWLSPGLVFVMAVGTFVNKQMGKPWIWKLIHDLLDQFCASTFREQKKQGQPSHHHRVTLFRRYSKWHPKSLMQFSFSDRLFPVERSGHLSHKTSTSFKLNDDPVEFEGIAGLTWVVDGVYKIADLPKLTKTNQSRPIAEYAEKTMTSESWVKSRISSGKPLGRSFCGIPVSRKGKPWGVLVVDSQSADSLDGLSETMFGFIGHTFSKLIEKV